MRELNIGETKIRVRATPLALLYYKQAFKMDLVSDLVKMQGIETDLTQFDALVCLQITWAMAKADIGLGKQFPDFENWLNELDGFIISDHFLKAVMEEAADGFFRGGIREKANPKQQQYSGKNRPRANRHR